MEQEIKEVEWNNISKKEKLKHKKWRWVEHLERKEMYGLSTYLELHRPQTIILNEAKRIRLKNKATTPKERKIAETMIEDLQNTEGGEK